MSANGFARERKPVRTNTITIRVTDDERALLGRLADKLGFRGMADVVRNALDLYLKKDRDAKAAVRSTGGRK